MIRRLTHYTETGEVSSDIDMTGVEKWAHPLPGKRSRANTGFTVRENELLNRLAAGELDGLVGVPEIKPNGGSIWLAIRNGRPGIYIEQPEERKIVDGRIVRTPGHLLSISYWETEEEKLEFLKEHMTEICKGQARTDAEAVEGIQTTADVQQKEEVRAGTDAEPEVDFEAVAEAVTEAIMSMEEMNLKDIRVYSPEMEDMIQ